MNLDALVIGGGPAGATTALLLAKAGWSVGIVEKKTFPRRKVCGEFISATSLPLLQQLGIADFYFSNGGPEVRRVGLYAADKMLASVMPTARASHGPGRALRREYLDLALLNKAKEASATVWQPGYVTNLQRHSDQFTCTITDNNKAVEISTRLVIMANGSWERGIEPVQPTIAHRATDLLAFKAHFCNSTLAADLMPLIAFPGGYGGLVNTDNGLVTLSCCIRRDTLQKARLQWPGLQAGEAVLHYIKGSCRGVREVLLSAEREGSWLAVGPIKPGIRKHYQDNMFFVGNIAGEAHPIVAEGISMAMQSAWLLAKTLIAHQSTIVSGKSLALVGEEYSKSWRKHFAPRIHTAAIFAKLAMNPHAVSLMLPLLTRFPNILTFGATLSGKIQQVVPSK